MADGVQMRQKTMRTILETLKKNKESGQDMGLRKFKALISINCNTSIKRLDEYLQTLKDAETILLNDENDYIEIV
jgi:predicted transcriptional regulator